MIPVIMRNLMAEMAEQRAIGLAHRLALALALDVVGLSHIERDEAAGVPGHRPRRGCILGRGKKIEGEAVFVLTARGQRQAKLQRGAHRFLLRQITKAQSAALA